MSHNATRRTVLRGLGTGALTLLAARPVAAGGTARYIVTATGPRVQSRIEQAGYTVQHALADESVFVVAGPADDRAALEGVAGVQRVVRDLQFELQDPAKQEPAETTTDEDLYPLQWDKHVTDAATAHQTSTGAGTQLAIIDTGIDVDHPDLAANVNADAGRLFKHGQITHDAQDVYGHGSHVAGIAAASDDGTTGVVGTAPDAELVSLRVFYYEDIDGDGEPELTTTTGDILLAIHYAAASLGADAMNMSIGTPPLPPQYNRTGVRQAYRRVIQDAVRRGSLVVVSAGNSATNLGKHGLFTVPNSVPGAMSVSATGPNDELVFYSNYGTSELDIGAPGGGYETLAKTLCADYDGDGDGEYPVDEDDDGETDYYEDCALPEWPFPTNLVLSTVPPELYGGNYYAYFAGTSMAAPQVTGAAGLVRAAHPALNPEQVEQALEQGADLVRGKNSATLGAGRLNAAGALDAAAKFR